MSAPSIVVVLRTNRERTARLAEQLLKKEFDDVVVIQVSPFHAAVRECFRIAEERKARWLVTCDGDVLVTPGIGRKVAAIANRLPSSEWQAIGQVHDKLAGCNRLGGLRLYRVSHLHLTSKVQIDNVTRPEAELCRVFPNWTRLPDVFGTHDYEQFYYDLYRKGAQHRVKHPGWSKTIVPQWVSSKDQDLLTALAGWHGDPIPRWKEKDPL